MGLFDALRVKEPKRVVVEKDRAGDRCRNEPFGRAASIDGMVGRECKVVEWEYLGDKEDKGAAI